MDEWPKVMHPLNQRARFLVVLEGQYSVVHVDATIKGVVEISKLRP